MVTGELHLWKLAQQSLEGHFAFQPGQWCTNTKMNTNSKCKMTVIGTFDIKAIWINKCCRVTIGRANHQVDDLALAQRLSLKRHVLLDNAGLSLEWAFVTQHLLHGLGYLSRVCGQALPLVGVSL